MKSIKYILPLFSIIGMIAMEQPPIYKLTRSPQRNFQINPRVRIIGDQIIHGQISHDEGFEQLSDERDKQALERYLRITNTNRMNE